MTPRRFRIERLETRAMLTSLSGDFNGDGYDDLAVGAPGDSFAGAVHIIYGSASKLTTAGNQVWRLDSPGVNGVPHAIDAFGETLAAGDFDDDGFDDLAIGNSLATVAGKNLAGAVNILYGSAGGLTASGDQQFHLETAFVNGDANEEARFGGALAVGDFDNDGRDDLAIGARGEHLGSLQNAGAVHVLYGRSSGLSATGDQRWTYNTSGIDGVAEAFDAFGAALAVGDFNGDGRDDLAAGARRKNFLGFDGAGSVTVIHGSSNGLTSAGDQLWRQSIGGLIGTPENQEGFGSALATGDFNGDGFADLAASAPDANLGAVSNAGEVVVLYGSNQKLRTNMQQLFTLQTLALVAGEDHRFGGALAAGDFDNNGRDELAVGVTGYDMGGATNAGLVAVIRSGQFGLSSSVPLFFTQDTANIPDTAETGDFFGYDLTIGDYNGDNRADLVIAAGLEDFAGDFNAGALHVLYGSNTGVSTVGNHFFTQDTIGILSSTAANNEFGTGLA